jgi:hypothetical protein
VKSTLPACTDAGASIWPVTQPVHDSASATAACHAAHVRRSGTRGSSGSPPTCTPSQSGLPPESSASGIGVTAPSATSKPPACTGTWLSSSCQAGACASAASYSDATST